MIIYTEIPTNEIKYDPTPIYYVYMYLRERDSVNGCKGSPYYIGKGKNKRAFTNQHNVFLPKNKSNIRFIETDLDEETAFMWEEYWISFFGRIDLGLGCLHNLTNGGDGPSGTMPSEITRQKMRDAKQGFIPWNKGLTSKDDSRILSGESASGFGRNPFKNFTENEMDEYRKKCSENSSGENNSFFGKHHAEETKQEHSEFMINFYEENPEMRERCGSFTRNKTYEEAFGIEKATELRNHFSEIRSGENNSFFGKTHKDQTLKEIGEKSKNMARCSCLYCKKEMRYSNFKQWHGEKCKNAK